MEDGYTFWDALRESVIIQGLLAVITWGAVAYLAVSGATIPKEISDLALLIGGFYFGQKVGLATTKRM